MKKIILLLIALILIGCSGKQMTPKDKVKLLLDNYKGLDVNVLNLLDYSLETNKLNENQKSVYRDIMRKQYKDLEYNIVSENIGEKSAVVEVEIEVYNYYLALEETNDYFLLNQDMFLGDDLKIDSSKYVDYKLDLMGKVNERVKHLITFNLHKMNDIWLIDDIDETMIEKIHGVYSEK